MVEVDQNAQVMQQDMDGQQQDMMDNAHDDPNQQHQTNHVELNKVDVIALYK